MKAPITEEDILFCESLYHPRCFSEALFTNYDNLAYLEEGKLSYIRNGQIPLLSFEYLIAYDSRLSEKKNFSLKVGAGSLYCLGGRNFGKSVTLKLDMLNSLVLNDAYPMAISSYDAVHLRTIIEPVIAALDNHPILSAFKKRVTRSPTFRLESTNNSVLESINMNISAKAPGNQFFGKHLKKLFIEEWSFETEEVNKKRIDARHELGCIEKFSGMCNFTKFTPAGRVFNDKTKKPWVLNLPQYINPTWDDAEKLKAIKKHNGEESIGFRMFVKGEVVEEGISVIDMARIRPYYNEEKILKTFEINKDNFISFEHVLIVERPSNSEVLYMCADIGETAPTEIAVLSRVEKQESYQYLYDIVLRGLTDKEIFKILKYLGKLLNANFIGIDVTDGTGRSIYRSLEEIFPKENLVWCSFNAKIPVDFEKNEFDQVVFKDGKPQYIEEYVSEWSIKHLITLLYEHKIDIPENCYKLDEQLNKVVSFQSGSRITYKCVAEENHALQSMQVFAIAEWMNRFNLTKPINQKKFFKGII